MAGVRILGPIDATPFQRQGESHDDGTPLWTPTWLPNASSLDYLSKLATFAFFTIGALYVIGFRPFGPVVRAANEIPGL
jgi:hypothetical protein